MVVTKAGVQFENHSLVKFSTRIPKLNKEEGERMSNVLIHCKAEARLECCSQFPKQVPATEEADPLQTNVTQVLPSQLDDQLFQDIGCIFRGGEPGKDNATISRHERRQLKRLLKMYLPGCCFQCDVTEESPKDAFIAILRSLSGRSDQ